eukprot:jgi/Picre1/27031/NNA_000001.t1
MRLSQSSLLSLLKSYKSSVLVSLIVVSIAYITQNGKETSALLLTGATELKYAGTVDKTCAKQFAKTREGTYYYYSHIPKTGGTTSYAILEEIAALTNGSLILCPYRTMKFENCNLILSHFSTRGRLPKLSTEKKHVLMTTVRNPMALTLSSVRWMVQVGALHGEDITDFVRAFEDFRSCKERMTNCSFSNHYKRGHQTTLYNMINRQSNFLYYPTVIWEKQWKTMLDEFDHIGISEFRFATRCLLMYQFGVFDRHSCYNACTSFVPEKNSAKTKIAFPSEIFSSLEYISRNDNILYAKALSRFMEEISCIEEEFNVTLICRDPYFDGTHPVVPLKPGAYNV